MRRIVALLLLTACAAVAAGCSGQDAQEAQELLAASQAATAKVRSATFTLRVSLSGGPEEFSMTMTGGGYMRGKHAGDMYATVRSEQVGIPQFVIVQRNELLTASVDGRRLPAMPAPRGENSPLDLLEFARYVEDVSVEHGKLIDGQPMTKLAGVVDTAGLVKEALSSLGDMTAFGGSDFDFSEVLRDMRVVLYISDVTHLPMRGLVDFPMKAAGQELEMHIDFAYTSINEGVVFPDLR
jgi:hypothetical protein